MWHNLCDEIATFVVYELCTYSFEKLLALQPRIVVIVYPWAED